MRVAVTVYARVYVCIARSSVCLYVCMCVRKSVLRVLLVCLFICVCASLYSRGFVCVSVFMPVCTYVCLYVRVDVCLLFL